ncbi:MAG TPA: hypothetical protein VJA19_15405 [Pseudomonas sp.]|nr:hypothetical protein [Pseudomonas sp.]
MHIGRNETGQRPVLGQLLSLLGTPSGLFNRLNYRLFGTRLGARVFYPLGKAFRNLLLKLLGIGYIGNLKPHA